eukprot:Skav219493  [mRNA]  locus=scaffold937:61374:64692:- [translate_table: standard]
MADSRVHYGCRTDDLKWGPILRFIRSPFLHSALGHAHSVSCVGLFVSIILLCATMVTMKGGITVCESCLAIVAIGFAFPHMILAGRRLSDAAVCLGMDAMTALSIIMSYPHLNTWFLRIGVVAVIGCAVAAQYSPVREIYLDWLEPIFITRTQHKRMPNQQRQLLRMVSWSVSWHDFLKGQVELRVRKAWSLSRHFYTCTACTSHWVSFFLIFLALKLTV